MARARNIKPGVFKNEILVELPAFTRLLFIGLWTLADREGRVEDRPKRIKLELFPYDNEDIDAALDSLFVSGFINRYQVADKNVISILNFLKHQNPHGTEKDSDLPDESGNLTVHERDAKGYITGTKRANNVKSKPNNVTPPEVNVASVCNNTLNPDSLNPESLEAKASMSSAEPKTPAKREKSRKIGKTPSPAVTKVVALYNELLPNLPAVRVITDKRISAISDFIAWVIGSTKSDGSRRAENEEEALEWIAAYFKRANLNDFVMGRTPKAAGHENWEADIEYVMSDKGKTQIIEKTREAA